MSPGRGRPVIGPELRGVRVDQASWDAIEALVEESGDTRAEVVRALIAEALAAKQSGGDRCPDTSQPKGPAMATDDGLPTSKANEHLEAADELLAGIRSEDGLIQHIPGTTEVVIAAAQAHATLALAYLTRSGNIRR